MKLDLYDLFKSVPLSKSLFCLRKLPESPEIIGHKLELSRAPLDSITHHGILPDHRARETA